MSEPHTDASSERERLSQALFDRPSIYLRNDAHIDVRARAVRDLLGHVSAPILDVGCGDGRVSLQFLDDGARVTLVDAAPSMLELARARIPAERADAVELVNTTLSAYRPGRPFPVVLCLGVLAHVPDVGEAVRSLAELVAPGGCLLVQITDHDEPLASVHRALYRAKKRVWDRSGYAVHETRGADLLRSAQDAGLRPEGMRQYWVLPPGTGRLPTAWGRRLLEALYASETASAFGVEKIFLLRKPGSAA